jgi:regulator of replication initiation timing
MSEANQPSNELAQLRTENKELKEDNERLKKENQGLRKHLFGVISQISIGRPLASDGTPLLKIKTINDAQDFLAELGLRV